MHRNDTITRIKGKKHTPSFRRSMQRGSSRLKASTFLNSSSNLCTKPSSVATLSRLSLLAETSAKKREMGLGTKPKLKSKLSSMKARWCCGGGLGDFL